MSPLGGVGGGFSPIYLEIYCGFQLKILHLHSNFEKQIIQWQKKVVEFR